jgi:hypothetical protein
MTRLNQAGSHLVGIALLVLVLGFAVFAGYTVSHRNSDTTTASTTSTKTAAAPGTIKNASDLQQTAQALDTASSQLSSSLDDSGMNADLNSML